MANSVPEVDPFSWALSRSAVDLSIAARDAIVMPPAVVAQVFRTPKDGIGTADGNTRNQRIIFNVTDIKEPTFEAAGAAAKPLQDQLRASYGEELLSQYVTQLETDLDTNINQQALNQAVGRATNN